MDFGIKMGNLVRSRPFIICPHQPVQAPVFLPLSPSLSSFFMNGLLYPSLHFAHSFSCSHVTHSFFQKVLFDLLSPGKMLFQCTYHNAMLVTLHFLFILYFYMLGRKYEGRCFVHSFCLCSLFPLWRYIVNIY